MKKYLIMIISIFLFNSCIMLMDHTGRLIDGSVFAEKTLAKYVNKEQKINISFVQNKNKEKFIIIDLKNYPMIKLRASLPEKEDTSVTSINLFFTTLEYLSGSTYGWNEFTLQLLGTIHLIYTDDNNFYLELKSGSKSEDSPLDNMDEIEKVQISGGRIHRYDTRITGNDALNPLRNRYERIKVLTEWMNSINNQKSFNTNNFKKDIKNFEKYWKPILLPEMVSKRKKHDNWHENGDIYQRAEDIRWNTGYTERVFPKELWPVRNSGTLLRDWEEAFYWLYFEYEWDNIIKIFSRPVNFIKTR